MRKYVDLMADVDWTPEMLRERGAAYVRQEFPDALEITEKAQAVTLGYGLMTTAEQARSRALYDFRQEIVQEVAQQWEDMQLLRIAWGVERAQFALNFLRNFDAADARAPHEAVIAAASPEALALVAARNRNPQPDQQP